jgi:hypothetical protein
MNSPQTKRSILLGAFIAPLGAPIAFLMYALASALAREGLPGLKDWPVAVVFYFFFGLPIAYAAMLALGLPYVTWLRRISRLTWLTVCAGAVATGALALPAGLLLIGGGSQFNLASLMVGGFIGLVCGVLFCVVTGPNNSFKPTPHRGVGYVPTLR